MKREILIGLFSATILFFLTSFVSATAPINYSYYLPLDNNTYDVATNTAYSISGQMTYSTSEMGLQGIFNGTSRVYTTLKNLGTNWTLTWWQNFTGDADNRIMPTGDEGSNDVIGTYYDLNQAYFKNTSGSTGTLTLTTNTLALNTQTHFAFAGNGTSVKVWVNGDYEGAISVTSALEFNSIGKGSSLSGYDMVGTMDDFRVYNYTLSSSQIADIYSESSHLNTIYVNSSDSSCSDYSNYFSSTPLCTLGEAVYRGYPGSTISVYGTYCEGIDIGKTGISGNSQSPINIRGTSSSQKAFLNGSCATETNGVGLTGESYWNISYLEIYNFSYDGFNVHYGSSIDSIGISFQDSIIRDTGYDGAGDGVSFHENCSGNVRNIIINGTSKMGIVDINNAKTNYTNITMYNIDNEGIRFSDTTGYRGVHYLNNITVYNTNSNCLMIDDHEVHFDGLYCEGSFASSAILLKDNTNLSINLTNFKINNSIASSSQLTSTNNTINLFLSNGEINGNITFANSSSELINVTYGEAVSEILDSLSDLTRKFYLDVTSNIAGTSLTLTNSTSTIYSASSPNFVTQLLTAYTNIGGTITNKSYTLSASASGYVSQSQTFSLTENTLISFLLEAVEESVTSSSEGGFTTYFPTEQNLIEGYSAVLFKGRTIEFNFENESHKITLISLKENEATISLASEPITKTLKAGEIWKIDLDSDGIYDLKITFPEIKNTILVNISIQLISEEISTKEEKFEKNIGAELKQESSNSKMFTIIATLIIFIIVAIALFAKKHAPRIHKKRF